MSKKRIVTFTPVVLSVLLALGTATVFRACAMKDDGTWMHCHTAQTAAIAAGCILGAVFIAAAFSGSKTLRIALYAACVIGAAVVFMIPGGIVSMCMMDTMRCYAVMRPFVRVMSVLIIAASLLNIVQTLRT